MTSPAHDIDFEKRYQAASQRAREFSATLEGPSLAERIAHLPKRMRDAVLGELTPLELARLRYDWATWARPKQDPDLPPHRTLFLLGGRGAGKTISGANRIRRRVEAGARSIAIVGPKWRDIERYQINGDGASDGVLTVFPPHKTPKYNSNKALVFFHRPECSGCASPEGCGGAIAYVNSAEDPELRGPNLDTVWCLVGETMITMGDGSTKRIDAIRAGDKVATRKGPRRVAWAGRTRRDAPLWRVTASNGAELVGTGDHEVLANGIFTRIKNLKEGDELCTLPTLPNSTESVSGFAATTSEIPPGNSCTASFGRTTTDRSPPAASFTIATETSETIGSKTSSCSPTSSTDICTVSMDGLDGEVRPAPSKSASNGNESPPSNERASDAAPRTKREAPTAIGAARRVGSRRATTVKRLASLPEHDDVYDLTIEDVPEFFANGILVHNCDEPAKWRYLSTIWSNIELATRLRGDVPIEIIVTGTPRPLRLFRELIADEETITILMSQSENAANLDASYLARMNRIYGGTRLGRQELEGEILSDNPDALFQASIIDGTRVEFPPMLEEIAVSVDPAIAQGADNDETGIIAGGRDAAGQIYILADASMRASPEKWGDEVIKTCKQLECDTVVGERNRGGDLVAANVRAAKERKSGAMASRALKIVDVYATRGKYIRAEPVSALHERGMIHIVGVMPELEAELTEWNPKIGGASPNRLDAFVWLVWHLARLGEEEQPDYHVGFKGLRQASAALRSPAPASASGLIASHLPRAGWGSKL
jgi:phage terminase large subunit-like protein